MSTLSIPNTKVLHKITCPTLILGAKDDPLMMPVPRPTIARNKRLLLVETEDGGHMGWVTWRFYTTEPDWDWDWVV